MAAMTRDQIRAKLQAMPEWYPFGKAIGKEFPFKSFLLAIEFVNRVAATADRGGHHPKIIINYNVVTVLLSTHSEGGVTQKDFDLAHELDRLAITPPA
jgi:4a-hydroxytetrahydrobiopterin dehydratase